MRNISLTAVLIWLALPANAGEQFAALAYHDVRNDVTADYDHDQFAISTQNLAAHFAWLKHQGFTAVSIDDLQKASRGDHQLPDKAILLTFDDGLKSVYTDVYPLLKIFNYPAVVSVVTDWIDIPLGEEIAYGDERRGRDGFLTWEEIREMQESGLVTIASHTDNLHRGVVANPQDNLLPAAVSRAYLDNQYETHEEFQSRVGADLHRSAQAIEAALVSPPNVVTWPYGKYTLSNLGLAAEIGMPISMSLDTGMNSVRDLSNIRRILIQENPGINSLSSELLLEPKPALIRAAQVDLDYVYDEDPEQQKRNLDQLLERIKDLAISHVFLQAFADPDANGSAAELYFPNRHLPVRADLFSRVAWQLKTRSDVNVFAWMPLMAYDSRKFDASWKVIQHSTEQPDPQGEPRLSPFNPDARQFVREIYEDLAAYTTFDGVLIHDDGRFNEQEDASAAAMDAYRSALGRDFDIPLAHDDPQLLQKWSRLKTEALIEFGDELTEILRDRKPDLKTVRNLFAPVVLDESSEAWFAQSFSRFLESYDYVALMAMPYMENSKDPDRYLDQLAAAVAQHNGGLDRTIFELQAVDWRSGTEVPAETLFRQMRNLQAAGVKHLAYYPDDFITDRPALDQIRQGISLADYPFYLR